VEYGGRKRRLRRARATGRTRCGGELARAKCTARGEGRRKELTGWLRKALDGLVAAEVVRDGGDHRRPRRRGRGRSRACGRPRAQRRGAGEGVEDGDDVEHGGEAMQWRWPRNRARVGGVFRAAVRGGGWRARERARGGLRPARVVGGLGEVLAAEGDRRMRDARRSAALSRAPADSATEEDEGANRLGRKLLCTHGPDAQ
jgi:hypothetical protein